jgi:EAL domain-containing protein (putative c-di-GMP-specific phosphodiesterase class I)
MGCDQAQGWLVGLPMDAETTGAWIRQHRQSHGHLRAASRNG